ncbi:hypothetical protein ACFQE1_01980 [Halobium palmae]|uniref:Uncharacterized protein n=1 Tax=Halobium palmae TaxID=1776492 RepID=A0ABD5RUU2_9EURY
MTEVLKFLSMDSVSDNMGFDPRPEKTEQDSESNPDQYPRLDPKTIARIDKALEGTINVDLTKLSADDKFSLLIDRYDRKARNVES